MLLDYVQQQRVPSVETEIADRAVGGFMYRLVVGFACLLRAEIFKAMTAPMMYVL